MSDSFRKKKSFEGKLHCAFVVDKGDHQHYYTCSNACFYVRNGELQYIRTSEGTEAQFSKGNFVSKFGKTIPNKILGGRHE